jgi:hypothetical protein
MPTQTAKAEAILQHIFTPEDEQAARDYLARFTHTTTALALFAAAIESNGDELGADLLVEAIAAMAEHEADGNNDHSLFALRVVAAAAGARTLVGSPLAAHAVGALRESFNRHRR